MLRPTVSVLEQSTLLGLTTRSLLLSDCCGFVALGSPLCREDGSVVYNCYWPSPAQSISGMSPVGTIFYCLRFETSLFVASYDSQGHCGGKRPRLHTGWQLTAHYHEWSNFLATRIYIIISNNLCYSVSLLPLNVLTEPLPSNVLFRVYSLQRKSVFDEPLASNALPLWLHYSGFQASCHIMTWYAAGSCFQLRNCITQNPAIWLNGTDEWKRVPMQALVIKGQSPWLTK
jgi:hypothetical protein